MRYFRAARAAEVANRFSPFRACLPGGLFPATKFLPAVLQQTPTAERSQFATAAVRVKLPAGKQILDSRETPGVMAFPITEAMRA